MYLRFYDLNKSIFQFNTNPEFTWISDKLGRTLAQLENDLLTKPAVYQLTGDVGTGKSTLVNILIKRLPTWYLVAEVSDSSLGLMDLLNYLSIAFEIGQKYKAKDEFQIDFEKFLKKAASEDKKVLIVIDESQALSLKMLDHLQWLMTFNQESRPVLSLLLVGQRDLRQAQPGEEGSFSSQIGSSYTVEPLDLAETTDYVQQSLKYAGAEREIFTLDALQAVYQLSHGVLRNINILCDNTMLAAHFKKEKEITRERVKTSSADFDLSSEPTLQGDLYADEDSSGSTQPVLRSLAKIAAAVLCVGLLGGGIYYYNSIELIPETSGTSSFEREKPTGNAIVPKGASVSVGGERKNIIAHATEVVSQKKSPVESSPDTHPQKSVKVGSAKVKKSEPALFPEKPVKTVKATSQPEPASAVLETSVAPLMKNVVPATSGDREMTDLKETPSDKLGKSGAETPPPAAPAQKKAPETPEYESLAEETIATNDREIAHHAPPASTFEDERMVQPYTAPEEERTEDIDPGDVIDWLIKQRKKN